MPVHEWLFFHSEGEQVTEVTLRHRDIEADAALDVPFTFDHRAAGRKACRSQRPCDWLQDRIAVGSVDENFELGGKRHGIARLFQLEVRYGGFPLYLN